jgi:hypothetical protein
LAVVLTALEMSAKGEALMSLSPRKIGSVVLMLVLVHLFTPAMHALPPSRSLALIEKEGIIPAAWGWLVSLISPVEPELQGIREKAGSSMDPNGCPYNSAWIDTDAGSSMDPNGSK